MKPTIVLAAVLTVIAADDHGLGRSRVDAQTSPTATRAVPQFRVHPAWPKIPNGWQFGQVSSVAVDAQDHV